MESFLSLYSQCPWSSAKGFIGWGSMRRTSRSILFPIALSPFHLRVVAVALRNTSPGAFHVSIRSSYATLGRCWAPLWLQPVLQKTAKGFQGCSIHCFTPFPWYLPCILCNTAQFIYCRWTWHQTHYKTVMTDIMFFFSPKIASVFGGVFFQTTERTDL